MAHFFIRLFIPDHQNTESSVVRGRYGRFAGIVGIVSNVILFALKFLAGLFFHSISVMADAVNNLSDAASSVVMLIGFKIAGKPADEKHPYGHARMEYIAGLVISFAIILLGLQLIRSSVDKILHPAPQVFSWLTVGVLLLSVLVKLWLCLFHRKIARLIGSTTVDASAADNRNDVFSTTAVLISVIVAACTDWNPDGYIGVAVALFIIVSGVKLVGETINPLLGMAPDPALVKRISSKITEYDGVLGLHDLVVHNYGSGRCFASVHVEMSAQQDILISHDTIDNIERDFMRQMGIHLVIHLDPVVPEDDELRAVHCRVNEIVKEISPELSTHDFRAVCGATHTNLIFDVTAPYSVRLSDEELICAISDRVREMEGNFYAVIVIDRSYVG